MDDCATYTESQLTSRLYRLLVEQQSFERQVFSSAFLWTAVIIDRHVDIVELMSCLPHKSVL